MTIANHPAASGYMSAKLPIRRRWPGAIHIRDGRPYPPDLHGPWTVWLERLAVSQHGTQRQRRSQGADASLSYPSQTWPTAPGEPDECRPGAYPTQYLRQHDLKASPGVFSHRWEANAA